MLHYRNQGLGHFMWMKAQAAIQIEWGLNKSIQERATSIQNQWSLAEAEAEAEAKPLFIAFPIVSNLLP